MRAKKSVTLKDVAAQAGVSVVTVSKVLNFGDEHVASTQTVKTIYEAASRLGYQKKINSDKKRSGTASLGILLVPRIENPTLHPFYDDVYNSIKNCADLENIQIDFYYSLFETERNSFIQRRIIESKAKDLILIGGSTDTYDRYFKNIVNISFGIASSFSQNTIQFDMYTTVKDVVGQLLRSGRKRILYFGGGGRFRRGMLADSPKWRETADQRETSFLDAHKEHGRELFEEQLFEISFQPEAASDILETLLLEKSLDFDAIFAGDDMVALACIKVLQKHAVRIPDQVAVVGFNNQDFCRYTTPSISTIELNHDTAARLAVELIRMKNEQDISPNIQIMVPCYYIKRHSCGL